MTKSTASRIDEAMGAIKEELAKDLAKAVSCKHRDLVKRNLIFNKA